MVEMPRHEVSVTFEQAIRALELIYTYVVLDARVATKSRRHRLLDLTSRPTVGWICNPPVGTPDDQIRTFIPKILADLWAHPKTSKSAKAGIVNLRCTLQAYMDRK